MSKQAQQPSLDQQGFRQRLAHQRRLQRFPRFGRPAQAEAGDGLFVEPAPLQIGQALAPTGQP